MNLSEYMVARMLAFFEPVVSTAVWVFPENCLVICYTDYEKEEKKFLKFAIHSLRIVPLLHFLTAQA